MKKRISVLLLCTALLLSGCAGNDPPAGDGAASFGLPAQSSAPNEPGGRSPSGAPEAVIPADAQRLTCRIIDGADTGNLILAETGGSAAGVYTVSSSGLPVVWESGTKEEDQALRDGMLVEVAFTGGIMETYPARIGTAVCLTVQPGRDSLCSLYLDVLEDLWNTDEGLNSDITELGVDLSKTRLSPSEQSGVAYAFGMLHGMLPIQGTFEELKEQGYLTVPEPGGTGDPLPHWEKGCLFTIRELDPSDADHVEFDAEKWRSGLGAYFFCSCTSTRSSSGEWSEYEIGSEAIS